MNKWIDGWTGKSTGGLVGKLMDGWMEELKEWWKN